MTAVVGRLERMTVIVRGVERAVFIVKGHEVGGFLQYSGCGSKGTTARR
jgi:hypothetical protein